MIGQVGSANAATKFLQDIGKESRIENVVFVASGKLVVTTHTYLIALPTHLLKTVTEKLDVTSSRLESDWKMDEWVSIPRLTTRVFMRNNFANKPHNSSSKPYMRPS